MKVDIDLESLEFNFERIALGEYFFDAVKGHLKDVKYNDLLSDLESFGEGEGGDAYDFCELIGTERYGIDITERYQGSHPRQVLEGIRELKSLMMDAFNNAKTA